MKGDFSRLTFTNARKNHYRGVLMQQGRVQVDADWNEQQEIQRYYLETGQGDVIGRCGAPGYKAGFEISTGAGQMQIGAGRFYVDGLLCENDTAIAYDAQPDLTDPPDVAGLLGGAGIQMGLVYLDVWQRHLTALDDEFIREKALGGPDTTTRVKTVWQVKVLPLASAETLEDIREKLRHQSDLQIPEWTALTTPLNGKLNARTQIDGQGEPKPCLLPPEAGFQGLENQLYRVEIHNGGPRHAATFKWSRENGSVVAAVEAIDGEKVTVHSTGRDSVQGFAAGQWVELTSDDNELKPEHEPGQLLQIETVDHATRVIHLKTPLPAISEDKLAEQHYKLVRWDQSGQSATADGVGMQTTWLKLEKGIEIQFSNHDYQTGDYWLIPARTVLGEIEWPPYEVPNTNPNPQLPLGIRHHYCPLALLKLVGANPTVVGDCRLIFPPLNHLTADDIRFDSTHCDVHNLLTNADTVQTAIDELCAQLRNGCTFFITPEMDLAAIFQRINAADVTHARICFQAGEYHIKGPLVVGGAQNSKGHLIITGFGEGTHLIADKAETFLRFENCDSVTVRDIYVEARRAGSGAGVQHLNGVLTFVDCGAVTVENTRLRCWSAPIQGATCITTAFHQMTIDWTTSVRIRGCRLEVGFEQAGILVFNAERTQIEDNLIEGVRRLPGSMSLVQLLSNKHFRAMARRALVSHLQYDRAPADMTNVETITFHGQRTAYFLTSPGLVGQWQKLLDSMGGTPSTSQALRERLKRAAETVLLGTVDTGNFPAFSTWRTQLTSQFRTVGAQGIIVSGSTNGGETRIINNSITRVLQGVRVGYSKEEETAGSPVRALGVQIKGNRVQMIITPIVPRHPEGVFVGSYSNELIIEANTITAAFSASRSRINAHVEGLKVYGVLGSMLLIRHNNVASVESAIRVVPLNGPHRGVHRWLVADNLAAGFQSNLEIPEDIDEIGNPPHETSYRYRDLINILNRLGEGIV